VLSEQARRQKGKKEVGGGMRKRCDVKIEHFQGHGVSETQFLIASM
jgi:hypothetical protein